MASKISNSFFSKRRIKKYLKFSKIFHSEIYERGIEGAMFLSIQNLKTLGYYPAVIIDVGAYVGNWTREVVRIFPNSQFLMIEAQSSKENELKKIISDFGQTSIDYQISLVGSVNDDNVSFYEMETGSSVYREKTSYPREEKFLSMCTLDSLVQSRNYIGSIFLKLDVQGYELEVLKGCRSLISRVDFILLEVSLIEYNEGAPLMGEVIPKMSELGFVVFDITDFRRKTQEKLLFQIDILFCRADHKLRQVRDFT